ncbi:MAG: hypothetical protein SGI74_08800 [Oligoflexia bacterium]|nr:hypothetical protein [Oligoflexia bacterium]
MIKIFLLVLSIQFGIASQGAASSRLIPGKFCLGKLIETIGSKAGIVSPRSVYWTQRLGVQLESIVKLEAHEESLGHRIRIKKAVQFVANQDLNSLEKADLFWGLVDAIKFSDTYFYSTAEQDSAGNYVFHGFSIVHFKSPTAVISSQGEVYLGLHLRLHKGESINLESLQHIPASK